MDMLKELAAMSEPGDENPAMDMFVDGIVSVQNELMNICKEVMKSAKERKDKLRRAVIWGDLK